jgi:hypothetical protein
MMYWTINDVENFLHKCDDDAWLDFVDIEFNIMRLGVIKYVTFEEDLVNDVIKVEFHLVKIETFIDGKFRGSENINTEVLEKFKCILANKNIYSIRLCYDYKYYEDNEDITWDKIIN